MANLPDLHTKPVKMQAIHSSSFLLELATSDRHALGDQDRAGLYLAGCFLASLSGREDLVVPPPPGWIMKPSPPTATYTCPKCGAVSHNPGDIEHRYCVACHVFEGDEASHA